MSQAGAEILHIDRSILVEVQPQVVILDEDLHVRVGAAYIGHELFLALIEHSDQHANEVCSFVIVKHDLFGQRFQLSQEFGALTLHGLEFFNILDVGICELVCLARLNIAQAFASLIEPQVEQVFGHDFQALQDLVSCLL